MGDTKLCAQLREVEEELNKTIRVSLLEAYFLVVKVIYLNICSLQNTRAREGTARSSQTEKEVKSAAICSVCRVADIADLHAIAIHVHVIYSSYTYVYFTMGYV